MTTSFTTSDQFEPQDGGFGNEPEYPEAFGIVFTPQVSAIAIGVTGLLISAYLAWTQVLPVWNELSKLNQQRDELQEKLNQINSNQLEQIIAQKNLELQNAEILKQDVMKFFTTPENLDTLLFDISNYANLSNIKMMSYVPEGEKQTLADDSLGSLAVNNVQIQNYQVNVEGTFSQLQVFLQDLERLQPLLVIKNLQAQNAEPVTYLYQNNQLTSVGEPTLRATMTIQAVFADVKAPQQEKPADPNQEQPPDQNQEKPQEQPQQ